MNDGPRVPRPTEADRAATTLDRNDRAVIVSYVVLAYAWSWAWWIPMAIGHTTAVAGRGWPTHLLGLTGPAVAAVVVTAVEGGRSGLGELWSRVGRWRVSPIWYAVIALTAAIALIPIVIPNDRGVADVLSYSGAPSVGLAVVVYVIIVNGFGEEIGWRGLLADRLLRHHSVGRTALLVWPVWALWHVPLFWVVANFQDFDVAETVGWVIGLGFGSVFLTWLYRSAARSILIVALWHSAYNFATATDAADGIPAALATVGVIVVAVVILRRPATWMSPDDEPAAAGGGP